VSRNNLGKTNSFLAQVWKSYCDAFIEFILLLTDVVACWLVVNNRTPAIVRGLIFYNTPR